MEKNKGKAKSGKEEGGKGKNEGVLIRKMADNDCGLGISDMIALQKKKGRGMIGWGRGIGRVSRDSSSFSPLMACREDAGRMTSALRQRRI